MGNDLTLEVLISTMQQENNSLMDRMNIQSDAIVVNQCDINKTEKFVHNGHKINFMSFNERGVGLSRNNALMRATADICLMADDDMVYVDGYKEIIINAFKNNPKADMIMFNVPIHKKDGRTIVKIKKNGKVRFYNSLKYGTVNIAFRREVIIKNNIFFNLLFGGGARYGSGEDSLFIRDALKNKLRIYSSTEVIAEIKENESTWFTGYNEKYFFDKGALFAAISNTWARLLCFQFIVRHYKSFGVDKPILDVFKKTLEGVKEFKRSS